jgi:hypothetical protein
VSLFEGMSKQEIRDAANPGATVHIDGRRESLSHGIQRAVLQTVGAPAFERMTPTEKMKVEHARLFKAFRDAEGRDPEANSDPEFWDAHATITKSRGGRVAGDSPSPAETAVRKDRAEGVSEALRKRLEDGPAPEEPAWIQAVLDRSR